MDSNLKPNPDAKRTYGSLHRDCCAIRVRRQTGHGYWATYRTPDGKIHAVQAPTTYGFDTPKQAREAARREIERSHNEKAHPQPEAGRAERRNGQP